MPSFRMLDEARIVANDVLQLKKGEAVAVFTDSGRIAEANSIATAAHEIGTDVIVVDISQHVEKVLASNEYFLTPPKNVIGAIENSNVSILTVNETYAFRIAHVVRHFIKLTESCSVYKIDPGIGTWNLLADDINRILDIGRKLMTTINGHDEVHVTTRRGTDLKLSIKGRTCLPILSIPGRGNPFVHPIPLWAECNWAPLEDRTEGRVFIDGITEATPTLRVVEEPVEWIVKNGRVVEVHGGDDADDFRKVVKTDEGSAVIGELGLGASYRAVQGKECEKARSGTAHLGLGDNSVYPGGKNRSKVHVDGGIRRVTVQVDGTTVVENGILKI